MSGASTTTASSGVSGDNVAKCDMAASIGAVGSIGAGGGNVPVPGEHSDNVVKCDMVASFGAVGSIGASGGNVAVPGEHSNNVAKCDTVASFGMVASLEAGTAGAAPRSGEVVVVDAAAQRRVLLLMMVRGRLRYRNAFGAWRRAAEFLAPSFAAMGAWEVMKDADLRSGQMRTRRHAGGRVVVKESALLPTSSREMPPWLRPLPTVNVPPRTRARDPPSNPSEAEQRDFCAKFGFWRELFLKEGMDAFDGGVSAISAEDASTSLPGTETRIGPELMADGARQALEAGRTIAIDAAGKPSLQVQERVWDRPSVTRTDRPRLKLRKLQEFGRRCGWCDGEMLSELEWGLRDGSESAPMVTSLSANHMAAVKRKELVPPAVQAEVKEGWIAPGSAHPYCIPCHVNPLNARDKSGGRVRLMANPTWDGPEEQKALFDSKYGALAGNRNVDRAAIAAIEWNSMESMGEAVGVFCEIGVRAGVSVRGWRDDLTKWFRQLPAAMRDYRMSAIFWRGEWYQNEHLEMGRVRAANIACRVSYMIAEILHRALDPEVAAIVDEAALTNPSMATLKAVMAQRRELMAGAPAQCTYWHCQVLQDDFGCVALSDEVQAHLFKRIPEVLAEYGVEAAIDKRVEDADAVRAEFGRAALLDPDAAGGSPSQIWKFLGGWFDMVRLEEPRMRAPRESVEKLAAQATETWHAGNVGRMVEVEKYQSTLGLLEFLLRFQAKGRPYLNRGYRQCRGISARRRSCLSEAWVDDVQWFVRLFKAGDGATPVLVDPYWLHPGLLNLNGDACRARPSEANGERGEGGFGGNVAHLAFDGRFDTKELMLLDISTLELLTAYFLVVVLGLELQRLRRERRPLGRLARRRFVIRCDNESACACINRGRASSAPMGEALRLLAGAEAEFGVEVRAEHIAGKLNTIADDLSRAKCEAEREAALAAMRRQSGCDVTRVELPKRFRDVSVVVSAASRQSRKAARERG